MIAAYSVNKKVVISISDETSSSFRLERCKFGDSKWLVFTGDGFNTLDENNVIIPVNYDFLDVYDLESTLYLYRCVDFNKENPTDNDYYYSNNVRVCGSSQIGYTFGNYKIAPGTWGEVVTPDDLRYTYLWGTDFKATNGQFFTDEQIRFYINASVESISKQLDITIKKKKIRCNAVERKLKKTIDYDVDESVYDFRWSRINRYGLIKTRQRPIIKLHNLSLLSRFIEARDLTSSVVVDKTKGLLKLMQRPLKPSNTAMGINTAVNMYGSETVGEHLFYKIDYDVGYESSDDIPEDLREVIAKNAAVNLLNVIGDGLMSGFSSSSLSMDGLSESFSSTQSATSAYFGARIKEYKDDIEKYINDTKGKYGHLAMGCL